MPGYVANALCLDDVQEVAGISAIRPALEVVARRPERVLRGLRRHPAGRRRAQRPQGPVAKARRGELPNFTGIDLPYEVPRSPEVHIDTTTTSAEEAAEQVVEALRRMGIVS